jgi:hypothetical protein
MGLARHEAKFESAGDVPPGLDELFGALDRSFDAAAELRRDAIARCLSLSEGWRDAASSLGGAFAPLDQEAGLTDDKE